jgi:hypothetical protein
MLLRVPFFVLCAGVVVWFVLVARLHWLLRRRQPEVFDSLGRPTLILNNTVGNGWAFLRFLLGGHFRKIDDPAIVRLCRFMRVFFFVYCVLFVTLLVFLALQVVAASQ